MPTPHAAYMGFLELKHDWVSKSQCKPICGSFKSGLELGVETTVCCTKQMAETMLTEKYCAGSWVPMRTIVEKRKLN